MAPPLSVQHVGVRRLRSYRHLRRWMSYAALAAKGSILQIDERICSQAKQILKWMV